jgi:hypothetical protein
MLPTSKTICSCLFNSDEGIPNARSFLYNEIFSQVGNVHTRLHDNYADDLSCTATRGRKNQNEPSKSDEDEMQIKKQKSSGEKLLEIVNCSGICSSRGKRALSDEKIIITLEFSFLHNPSIHLPSFATLSFSSSVFTPKVPSVLIGV